MKISLNDEDGNGNNREHFGFTIAGGKDKNAPVKIDAVIVGTPADEAGLQVPFLFSLQLMCNNASLIN